MVNNNYMGAVLEVWKENKEKTSCKIIGNSMSPMIKDGDILIIGHGEDHIFRGDIVVFKSNSMYVAHRVVQIRKQEEKVIFTLKGDRSSTFDQPITKKHIIGKVIEIRGNKGHINTRAYPWKNLNYILSILSYMSGKCRKENSLWWNIIRQIFGVRSKIFPKNKSIKQILINGVYKVANYTERKKINQKNMK